MWNILILGFWFQADTVLSVKYQILINILFQSLDALEEYTDNIQNTTEEGTNDNEHLIRALNDILNGNKGAKAESSEPKESTVKTESKSAGLDKWKEIKLGDTEINVLSKAVEMEKKIYLLRLMKLR